MLLGIDHLVLADSDPDESVTRLGKALGIEPGGGGRHDQLGTFNRLLWLSDSYIEVIGVFDRERAIDSWIGAPTVHASEEGGGLATWAIATDDIDGDVRSLRLSAAQLSEPRTGERRRADGRIVRWWLSTPPHLGPTEPPFLIQHDETAAEWTPPERASRSTTRARLRVLELPVPGAVATASRFARTLGIEWERPSSELWFETRFGAQVVRLREADGDGPRIHVGIDGSARSTFRLLGCRWIVNFDVEDGGAAAHRESKKRR